MRAPHSSRGTFLIEALIALLVVSISTATLMKSVGDALRSSREALYRSDALAIATATLGRMATEDPGQLAARYDAGGTGSTALAATARRLPGVTDLANRPSVNVEPGPSPASRRVIVTVRWQSPGAAPRAASMSSVVAR